MSETNQVIVDTNRYMGKKMGLKGRPGLLFVGILIIFLAVFYLTWKSMIKQSRKTEVKDIYSMNYQPPRQVNQPRSDLNDIWNKAKLLHGDNKEEDEDGNSNHNLGLPPGERNQGIKSPLSNLLHATPPQIIKEVMKEPYYKKPDESLKVIGGRLERFVHLDLKGAAPKVKYLKEIFPLFSRLGATGLLIEYEDMFPYSGKLEVISAKNSYTKDQIEEILALAKLNSLKVIPLIQTFGHMEFVLKALHMESLRESKHTPQVINVASNASYELIQELVSQILVAHPEASYLHVGCDEVYELGRGRSADIIIKEKLTTEALFLRHVKRVADIVASTSQKRVRPIIWDDELRKMSEDDIITAGLPASVDIMVWRYTQNISDKLTEPVWKKYGRLFKSVWAASSFKGATGSRQIYTEPQHHIINHFSWVDAISKYGKYVNFKGVALTGWQRFDHFATLCELMPVAIPSLAVCLATIRNGGFDEDIHKTTSSILGCSGMLEMSFPELDEKERKAMVSQDCRFPGHMVYYAIQQLWGYKQFQEEGRQTGWLSDYQIKHGFSNPGQLKVLAMRMAELQSELTQVKTPLQENLLQIYTEDTVEEWLDENVFEMERHIKEIQGKIKSLTKDIHWARRPLPAVTNPPPVTKAPVTQRPVGGQSRNSLRADTVLETGDRRQPVLGRRVDGSLDLLKQRNEIQNQMLAQRRSHQASITNNRNVEENRVVNKNPNLLPRRDNTLDLLQRRDNAQNLLQGRDSAKLIQRIESNRVVQAPQSKMLSQEHPNWNGNDRSQSRLGSSDAAVKGKLDLLNVDRVVEPSRNNNAPVGNQEKYVPGNQVPPRQRQRLASTDKDGSLDYLKRMKFNPQFLGMQKNDGSSAQNNAVENPLHIERDLNPGVVTYKPVPINVKPLDSMEMESEYAKDSRRMFRANPQMADNTGARSNYGILKGDIHREKPIFGDNNGLGQRKENERILAGMLNNLGDDDIDEIHKNLVDEMNRDDKSNMQ